LREDKGQETHSAEYVTIKKVIDYNGEQEGCKIQYIDALIQTSKPESYKKIPSVVIMDQERANASRV